MLSDTSHDVGARRTKEMGEPNPDYADLYTNKEDRLLKYAPVKDIVEEYLRYPTAMQRTHHIIYRGKRYEGEAVPGRP